MSLNVIKLNCKFGNYFSKIFHKNHKFNPKFTLHHQINKINIRYWIKLLPNMKKNNLKYSKNQLKAITFKNKYLLLLQKMIMKNNSKNMNQLKKTYKLRKPYKIHRSYLYCYVPKKKIHIITIKNQSK